MKTHLYFSFFTLLSSGLTSAADFYVVPGTPGETTTSGNSYSNAWVGFDESIDWDQLSAGDILYVCGTHNSTLTIKTPGVIIDGDCRTESGQSDQGLIDRSIDIGTNLADWQEVYPNIWEYKEALSKPGSENMSVSLLLLDGKHAKNKNTPGSGPLDSSCENNLQNIGEWCSIFKDASASNWYDRTRLQVYSIGNPVSQFNSIRIAEPTFNRMPLINISGDSTDWIQTFSGSNIWEYQADLVYGEQLAVVGTGVGGAYQTDIDELDISGEYTIEVLNPTDPKVKRLYVYSIGNPSSHFPAMAATRAALDPAAPKGIGSHDPAETGIFIDQQDNVTVRNMIIQNVGRGATWQYTLYASRGGIVVDNSNDVQIINNRIYNSAVGIQTFGESNRTRIIDNRIYGPFGYFNKGAIGAGIASVGNNALIEGNLIDGNIQYYDGSLFSAGRGIFLQMYHYPDFFSNGTKVLNNEVRNTGDYAIHMMNYVDPDTYSGANPVDVEIAYNYLHGTDDNANGDLANGTEEDGIAIGSAFDYELSPKHNFDHSERYFYGSPFLMHHNRIEGMQNTGIQVTNNWSQIDIYNNVISGSGGNHRTDNTKNGGPAIDTKNPNRIFNNTIYNTYGYGITVYGFENYLTTPANFSPTIANNVILKTNDLIDGGAGASAIFIADNVGPLIDVNNNNLNEIDTQFYPLDTYGIASSDISSNSISAPMLSKPKTRGGQFYPKKDSPLIETGVNHGLFVNGQTDFNKLIRDDNYDIGAYEYQKRIVDLAFDDLSDITVDHSGYANLSVNEHNISEALDGVKGAALKLSGNNWNQHLSIDKTELYGNEGFTMSGWIKFDDLARGEQRLMSLPGIVLRTFNDRFNFLVDNHTGTGVYPWNISVDQMINQDRWYHVAAVFKALDGNGHIAELYINGVLAGSDIDTASPIAATSGGLFIGQANTYAVIDEIQFYGRALSDSQIIKLSLEPHLKGHWRFDELSGTSIEDDSSYGNHGSVVGFSGDIQTIRSQEGKNGHSIQLLPTWNGQIEIADSPSLHRNYDLTASAWVLPNSTGQEQVIIAQGNETGGFQLLLTSNNEIAIRSSNGSIWQTVSASVSESSSLFNYKIFHHVAAVIDSENNTARLYLNGDELETQMLPAPYVPASSGGLSIGSNVAEMYIDDVKLYSTPLSSSLIGELMVDHYQQ